MKFSAAAVFVVFFACATGDAEREYYAGRFEKSIELADPARLAKYMSMRTFVMGGDFEPVIETAARAVESARTEQARAEALTWEAFARYARAMTSGSDDYGLATERADAALALRRRNRDPRGLAEALFYRGLIAERRNEQVEAVRYYTEALELAQRHGFAVEESYAQRHLGFMDQKRGDLVSARNRLKRSLDLRESAGFQVFVPFSVLSLAEIDTEMGDIERAEIAFRRAMSMAEDLRFDRLRVLIDLSWSRLREKEGRSEEARAMMRRALETSERIGYPRGIEIARQRLNAM